MNYARFINGLAGARKPSPIREMSMTKLFVLINTRQVPNSVDGQFL